MNIIYCYMENEGPVLSDFLEKYDADSEIHLYLSVIKSCEEEIFFCLAEMLSLFWDYDDKIQIVTDVPEIYFFANKLFSTLYEKIIYLEQNVKKTFAHTLNTHELLEYSIKIVPIQYKHVISSFIHFSVKETDLLQLYNLSETIRIKMESSGWKFSSFFGYICKLILFMKERADIIIPNNMYLFTMSLLMKIEYIPEHTNNYLGYILQSGQYNGNNYYFIWNQFKSISLRKLAAEDAVTLDLKNKMYEQSYQYFYSKVKDKMVKMPKMERNRNRIVILTIQLSGEGHAPTRTVIERCKAFKKLNKDVFLINTVEQYTAKGYIPMYDALSGTVISEYGTKEQIEIGNNDVIWFRQLPDTVPIVKRFDILFSWLMEIKPYYILSIGSGSVLADLAGNIIPCASMGLSSSTLPHTMNKMKILGRKQQEFEKNNSIQDDIIESRFTCELKQQKEKFTREQFNLSEEYFILAVIGIRLDYELDDSFLTILDNVCREGCFVVFAGIYNSYSKIIKKYEMLEQNSSFIGYCGDIMALMQICNLYVNPPRLGGGTSIIEAFSKGIPGVYLPIGDVYAVGGDAFSVCDYNEMFDTIMKYKTDTMFYQEMSYKAIKRAELMTSSVDAILELDDNICSRIEQIYW